MCGHTRDPIIYSKFHRNPLKGFGAPGGQNLALLITLASRFYNSLYYRTSLDRVGCGLPKLKILTKFRNINVLLLYHHAKFSGAYISHAAVEGGRKVQRFFTATIDRSA